MNTTTPAAPVPAFDESTAVMRPHDQLFVHAATARTVGYVQPGDKTRKQVHLFSLGRQFIASVPASEVPSLPTPAAATPPPVVLPDQVPALKAAAEAPAPGAAS